MKPEEITLKGLRKRHPTWLWGAKRSGFGRYTYEGRKGARVVVVYSVCIDTGFEDCAIRGFQVREVGSTEGDLSYAAWDQREVSREATVVEKHLWEVKHSYRCEEMEYTSGVGPIVYSSWESFEKDVGPFNLDLNLVFRWDWSKESQVLRIYFVEQRRGRYRSIEVREMREEDEPAVRRWLAPRWGHMQRMWNPISEMPSAEIETAEARIKELEARVRSLSARLVEALDTYPFIREGLEQAKKGSTTEGLETIREASYRLYGLRGD